MASLRLAQLSPLPLILSHLQMCSFRITKIQDLVPFSFLLCDAMRRIYRLLKMRLIAFSLLLLSQEVSSL